MAFQAVPGGIETVIHATIAGVPVVNVIHTKGVDPITDAQLAAANGAVTAWMHASLLPSLVTGYIVGSVISTDISVEGGHQHTYAGTATDHGAIDAFPAPNNSALVISLRTDRIGRSYRGRKYISGIPMADYGTAVSFTASATTAFATIGTNLLTTIAAAGQVLCVLSRYLDKAARVVGILTEVTRIIVDNKADSQRRRTAN